MFCEVYSSKAVMVSRYLTAHLGLLSVPLEYVSLHFHIQVRICSTAQ